MRREIKILCSVVLLALLPMAVTFGQSAAGHVRKGNRTYKRGEYKDAELEYRKALDLDSTSTKARYNLAASLYKQERYDEAGQRYVTLAEEQGGKEELGRDAMYNAANALFKSEKYDKSAELYKQVLRANPRDEQARYNLSEALRRLKKQQEQQKQQQNQQQQDQQQNQDKKDQQKDQENKDGKSDQQNQNDEQQSQGNQPKDEKQPQTSGQQAERPMSEEEAKQILQALEKQQGKAAEKVRKANQKGGRPRKPEKDW